MTRTPSPQLLQRRTRVAIAKTRDGKQVVIVVARVEHVHPIMTEIELHRRQPGEVVIRASGDQGLQHTRSGGRLRFVAAANPASIAGLDVDVFLVDPRVATTTELEVAMQIACVLSDERHSIVRPGDQVTVGQLAGR